MARTVLRGLAMGALFALLAALGPSHQPRRAHRPRHHRRAMRRALASWYQAAGGPIACGGSSYAMGVANRTLACGTRLIVCYRHCVRAVVFDRGPYVAGRDFDLSEAVKNATGFPDGVASIRYRIGG